MAQVQRRFVLCVRSGSYRASLEPRKVYRLLDDSDAEARGLLRVIDESGDDYLFPADLFVPIEVPAKAWPAFGRSPAVVVGRPARSNSRAARAQRRTTPR